MQKYKTAVQKQLTQNNSSNMECMLSLECLMLFIQYQISKIISSKLKKKKKKEVLFSFNPPTHIYFDRINNRLLFKIKYRYKLDLQTDETMKLFGSLKKI